MFIKDFASRVRRAGWPLALLCLSQGALAASPSVTLEGGPSELRDNIRHFLTIAEEPCNTPQWRLRALLRDVDRQIQSASQAIGFYQVESTKSLSRDDDCWALAIDLEPGEPMVIRSVSVRIEGEGEDDPAFESLRRNPGVREGERLNHGRYESFKSRFGAIASARGYFDARFERARINVNRSENTASIELHYLTGPRYRFGEINLSHDILGEALLQRYFTFEPGDPYDTEKLMELKSLFSASDYFQHARVAPRLQDLSGEEVPVDVELEGRKRRSYSIGAGFATDTGPRILLGYEDRYVNDRGHSWKAETRLSEVKSTIQTVYSIPMTRPAYESVQLVAAIEREDTRVALSDRYTVGARYTRWLESQWLQTYAINYELEDFIIGSQPRQTSHLLIPSFTLSRTKTDGSNYPTEGWSLMGRVSGSPETLGSDFSFLQLTGRAKYIQAVGTGRLLLRAEGGATAMDEFDLLPPSVRFFAGGDASVRGYSYKSLGPTNDEGEVVGGNHMLVGSIEYDYRFRPSWAAAVFLDAGNAFNDTDFTVKRAAGAGVRWISPIGPIRVDVARALDDQRGWQLHLSMGPDL